MYFFSYDHDRFDRYAEDHVNAVINIAIVLMLLAEKELTVSDLSRAINTEERKEKKRSVYDLYAVVNKLKQWGYITKIQNSIKYNTSLELCALTEQGKELLSLMPKYLLRGASQYTHVYLDYKARGLLS